MLDLQSVGPFNSRFDDYWRSCLAAGNHPEACGLAEGDKALLDPAHVLTEQEWDGLIEFGEYCSACHNSTDGTIARPPLFTDFTFANLGVPRNPENPFYRMDRVYLDDGSPINPEGEMWVDLGLGGFLRSVPAWAHLAYENDGKHRTPTVRNVAQGPGLGFPKAYMHNGALKSLKEVVHFYNTRDVVFENWPAPEVDRNVNREILEGVPLGNFQLDEEAEDAIVAFLKTLSDRPVRK
jgi:cytochrome c peroxidase